MRPGFSISRLRGANNEGLLALFIVIIIAVMTAIRPEFLAVSTLFAIIRNALTVMVFALGCLLVIISGQVDVSFPVIGIFAGYTVVVIAQRADWDPGLVVAFLIAILIGSLLGMVNGSIISLFNLPTLIVSLGTVGIFRGVLFSYIGNKYIANIPRSLDRFSNASLITVQQGNQTVRLHMFIIPVVILCILVHLLLTRTMFGRGIYAIGGDAESARQAGFPVRRIQLLIYVLVGVLAAIAGLMFVTMGRAADPQQLIGTELDVIAAVVLGGASITGGRGSVLGTALGVGLIALIQSSLILVGVPGTWQRAAVGVMLILGVTFQVISARKRRGLQPADTDIGAEVMA